MTVNEGLVFIALLMVLEHATATTFKPVAATSKLQTDEVTASLSCPPGFVPQGNSCVCADWPDGMVVCDEDSQRASMQIGYCMTYDNLTGAITAGACPEGYYRCDSYKFYYQLPSKASELNEHVCGPLNSQGMLCGECRNGFAASPLYTTQCVSCSGGTDYSWVKFIAIAYLPITIALLVTVVFAVSVVSAPMNAFIFFSQVTTTGISNFLFVEYTIETQSTNNICHGNSTRVYPTSVLVLDAVYDLWNLNFFSYLFPTFCLTTFFSRLQSITLKYAMGLYPLSFIVVLYVCMELHARNFRPIVCCWRPFHRYFVLLRRSVDPKTSVIDAIATFTLLSYVRFLTVTNLLLLPASVYNGHGEKHSFMVAYYGANTRFFHGEHLRIAIPAIFVLVVFIIMPPVLLLLYPISLFQKCLTRCKMNSQALRAFVETFQGCYKDGTKGTRDCRYFSGLYFVLRIIVLLMTYLRRLNYIFACALLYLFTAIIFALVRPYKQEFYNFVDTITFAIMASLYILTAAHGVLIFITGYPVTPLLVVMKVLYSLPQLYLILFIVCWVIDRKTGCVQNLKKYRLLSCFFCDGPQLLRHDRDSDAVPDRMLNPEQYEVLTSVNRCQLLSAQANNHSAYYGSY